MKRMSGLHGLVSFPTESPPTSRLTDIEGVDCSEGRDYALKIHSTFAEIIAYGQRPQHETRFPYLVSFIGQTGNYILNGFLVERLLTFLRCREEYFSKDAYNCARSES